MIFNAYSEQKESICGIRLISCGHIFAKPGREISRPHGREDWLLFYVAKESETFYFSKKEIAQAGAFVLYAPGEKQHHIYEGSKTAEFYYVHFQCDHLPKDFSFQSSKIYQLPFHQYVCTAFEEILEELLQKQPYYEKLCLHKLLHLLTSLEREVFHTLTPSGESFERIARVIHHMNRFYNQNLTLEDYAQMCNMSKYHFLRVFEQVIGSTPLKYRNNVRLEHAAEYLLEEKRSTEEIGTLVGYSSASYFSSAFKQKFGVSPKQYRQEKEVART